MAKRRASSTNKIDLNQYLPNNQFGYNLVHGLHKKYPIPHNTTKRDIGVKFIGFVQEDDTTKWMTTDYKSIKNIRPLDHITCLCIKAECSKGEDYNNNFANRMRFCAFKKSHHNKLHKGEPLEIIIASHLESEAAHYIGFEYQLIESHNFVDEYGNKTKWGPLTYLNVSTNVSKPYETIINECYGINSNKYSIGAVAMIWLQTFHESNEINESINQSISSNQQSTEPSELSPNEPLELPQNEPLPLSENQSLELSQIEPLPLSENQSLELSQNEPLQLSPNIPLQPLTNDHDYDYSLGHLREYDYPLGAQYNDPYNNEYSELKELYTITVQHNATLIKERTEIMEEKKKLEIRLQAVNVKNKRLSNQLTEISTISGIKKK
eukprot:195858_1